jgi:FMN phosphatase YigB (HAD superfamily)
VNFTTSDLGTVPEYIETVLLDVGGVLYVDPWQTVLLSSGSGHRGIAERLGLDPAHVATAAETLWPIFAVRESTESEYWSALEDCLGTELPSELLDRVSRQLLRPLAGARDVLEAISDRKVGVITDNTTFWYARQSEDLRLSHFVSSDIELVSSRLGCQKSEYPGLFALAAERCDPSRTLVIDDRISNIRKAISFGFRTHYARHSEAMTDDA